MNFDIIVKKRRNIMNWFDLVIYFADENISISIEADSEEEALEIFFEDYKLNKGYFVESDSIYYYISSDSLHYITIEKQPIKNFEI